MSKAIIYLPLSCFLLITVLPCPAQEKKSSPFSDAIPILSWEEYNKESPFIFLTHEYEYRLNNDWSVDETRHYRIKIQKSSAKELGEQKIYYNQAREEILDLQAFVETPDGQTFPYSQIQDLAAYQGSPMYSDMRVKVITLPQVNRGSIIDVKVKSKNREEVIKEQFARTELYPSYPHKKYRAVYILPKDKNIVFKQYRTVAPPLRQEQDGNIIYTFEYQETVPLRETEDLIPPYVELFGISSFSSMKSWDIIADWYRALVKKNMTDVPEITKKVEQLLVGKETSGDKARAILEFLQDNLRYVSLSFGDNTVEPHPTKDTFNNRYGDCKDWSILAQQMLKLAGITSNICLFNGEFAGNPQWGLPSVGAFNHVILEIFLDGKSYFVDPQLKYYDLGQFPQDYNNANLFVIEEEKSRFTRIPVASDAETVNHVSVLAKVDESGGAVYSVKAKLNTEISNHLRGQFAEFSDNGRENFFSELESRLGRGGRIVSPKLEGINERYGPVSMTFRLEIPQAYKVVNNMLILEEPFDQFFPNPLVGKTRRYPLFSPTTSHFVFLIDYIVPLSFQVSDLPESFDFKNEFFDLSRTYLKKTNKIQVTYAYAFKRGRATVDKYAEFQRFWSDYQKKSRKSIILKAEK